MIGVINMRQVTFSFIVPCFNVEKYIDECINSLLHQTFNHFEVLLINDGSTDGTYQKCLEWAKKDKRVRLFNKKNEGLSITRNKGIDYANGEYLIFVDSDDYIKPDSLRIFADILDENTEVLITRFIEAFSDGVEYRDENISERICINPNKSEAIRWIMEGSYNTWPAQKYIVSKKMIEKKKLRFKESFLHEDLDWTTKLCCAANNFKVCYYPWYFHRMERSGSITNVVKPKRITDVLYMAHSLIVNTNSIIYDLPTVEKKIIINRIMVSVYASLSHYKNLQESDKHVVIEAMVEYKSIFRYKPKLKYKLFVLCLNIIGYKKAMGLMALVS